MNDPGTAGPIREAADQLNPTFSGEEAKIREDDKKKSQETDRDFRDPNLYWFESTAGPLLAGTFGPIASAFNICALSSTWRVYLPPGVPESQGIIIKDPSWLLAINGISLVSALAANGALLLNMARRLKFVIAQPITIVGFLLSTGLLMTDLIALTASSTYQIPVTDRAAPAQSHALSSAFYYAIMAAAIYFLIALLMCWTVWGVYRGHFGRQFDLTAAQRTLMLQTMSFVTYLLLGALVFSHIEGWTFLDAVYWADVTLLTVGLGDFAPSTHLGRSLIIPFAIGGIVTIGLVIGSIRTLILERGQKKISARMMEKKRTRAIDSVDSQKHRIRVSRFQTMPFNEAYTDVARKRQQEFEVMRSVQDCAERDRKWMALCISTSMGLILWLAGAAVFYVAERGEQGWSYFQSLYFAYICLLTIGYGDLTPTSNSSKPFFVFWSLLAVPALTILISDMGDTVVQTFSTATMWIGSLTVFPGENGFRSTAKTAMKQLSLGRLSPKDFKTQQPPGFLPQETTGKPNGDSSTSNGSGSSDPHHETIHDRIIDRLSLHLEASELRDAASLLESSDGGGDALDHDIHFYHFILARECQLLLRDLDASPPKRYPWGEWEYYLKLMANDYDYDAADVSGRYLVPLELRLPDTKKQWEKKRERGFRWSWLSDQSPLMGRQSETQWLLQRLSACLEKELGDQRLVVLGRKKERVAPPVSLEDMVRRGRIRDAGKETSGEEARTSGREKEGDMDGKDLGTGFLEDVKRRGSRRGDGGE